nr:hypothetical protein [Kibdelosporangium sp. MJ126-NF4]CTQ94826.1 hypothetical protein [Kibdelosporangium sp. MJ126-NF4]
MTNEVTGSGNGVFQAGEISGDITMINAMPAKADLVTLWLNEQEIDDLKEQFVPGSQFDRACTVLRDSPVIVVCGTGTGRTFTGHKLLLHHGHSQIAHLNSARGLDTIEESELRHGAGYLWRAGEVDATAFTGSQLENAVRVMRSTESRLVITVDHESRVPHEAGFRTVRLTPPDAWTIARATIGRQGEGIQAAAMAELDGELGHLLNEDDPPEKAVRVAEQAVAVARGELDSAAAVQMLTMGIDQTIAAIYQDWTGIEFSMLLAVAVLENKPYDEVAEHAYRLDEMVRTAELPPDEKLCPREVFTKPKKELLRDICAMTEERKHPQHSGLQEETVRFTRSDWAEAVLCHVWREFLPVHHVLLSWLCEPALLDRFPSACVDALCAIIVRTPAHQPLRMIDHLAVSPAAGKRQVASWMLVRLAKDTERRPVVDETLTGWVDKGSPRRKAIAAVTYALRFSESEPDTVIDKLHRIAAGTTSANVRMAVVYSLLYALEKSSDNRPAVFDALCVWARATRGTGEADGPRQVALKVGMWVSGLTPNPEGKYVKAADMIAEHPAEVSVLLDRVLRDDEVGPQALNRLFTLADKASRGEADDADEPSGAQLLRILTLLTPDLRWWPSRHTVTALVEHHLDRRKQIRWIFTVARRVKPTA